MAKSWIFQANPAIYRIREALDALEEITWTVKQHRDEIEVGDRVYIWASGPSGGLLALTSVISDVSEREELPGEQAFWVSPPEGTRYLCVRLRVDERFRSEIRRIDLLSEPQLAGMKLFRMPQGTNYPLTEAEAVVLERLATEKPTFLDILERYRAENVVFQSVEKGAFYCIASVDENGCEVTRLSASEPQRVTVSLHAKRLKELQASGGRIKTGELDGTAAVRATLLQSAELGLLASRDQAVVLPDEQAAVELLCSLVGELNVDRSGGAPKLYKPALLACVVEAIGDGEISDHRLVFDTLVPRFVAKLEMLGSQVGADQAALAFFHLTNDLFWNLAYANVNDRLTADLVTPGVFRGKVPHAVIKEPFRWLLRSQARDVQGMTWQDLDSAHALFGFSGTYRGNREPAPDSAELHVVADFRFPRLHLPAIDEGVVQTAKVLNGQHLPSAQ